MPWSLRMTLMASAASLLPFLYVFWRFGGSLNYFYPLLQREIKYVLLFLILFAYCLPLIIIIKYVAGDIRQLFLFEPQLNTADYLFNFPFWLFFLTIVEILPYMITIDLIALALKLFFKTVPKQVAEWGHLLRVILLPGIFIIVIIRSYNDTYNIRLSEYQVERAGNQEITIALIADLQVDRYTQDEKIQKTLDAVNQDPPDLLFFAGDLVTRGKTYINQGIDALCRLNAGSGRIACIGDHDIWSDPDYIARQLTKCGWIFLHDAHTLIKFHGKQILITGITYAYSQRISEARLNDLLGTAPEADLQILLVHQPAKSVIESARTHGYDILLAGHTHGGQIVFKPYGITVTPTQVENDIFAGHTLLDSLNVFVSNGIGLTMMPLRYRASAEIVKIRLSF